MMIDSLLNNTAGIRRRARLSGGGALTRALALATQHAPGDSPAPGRRAVGTRGVRGAQDLRGTLFAADTRTALLAGSRHACAALIERALLLARQQLGRRPRLILGGGAADTVASLLRVRYSRQDDLVLRGLAVLAQAGIA